jgi:hypothetical protein
LAKPRQFVRFDEIEDVLSSLDLLALIAPLLDKQPSYWKWAIVAAHAALQGAMVSALRDSYGVSVLTRDSAKKMLDWLETNKGTPPEERFVRRRVPRNFSTSPPGLFRGRLRAVNEVSVCDMPHVTCHSGGNDVADDIG